MRFNIKEMKKQGIFLGILAGFLAVVILVSYITSLTPSIPTVEETPDTTQNQTGNSTTSNNKNDKTSNNTTTDKKEEDETEEEHVHNWVRGSTVMPTCTEGGYTINTCFCGESKTTNEKAALGHSLGEWTTQPADEDGVIYDVCECSVCDYTEKKKVGDANEGEENHDGETPPADQNPDDENENPDDENNPEEEVNPPQTPDDSE